MLRDIRFRKPVARKQPEIENVVLEPQIDLFRQLIRAIDHFRGACA
ncbi:hypothetical protein [Paraburkholderia bannensis]|nr:hypothetical protein [Paraburkholderia bannensis]